MLGRSAAQARPLNVEVGSSMQCSSCGFENMPGSDACARCASSLSIATAVMDVQPPRAGKLRKKIRRALPMGRTWYAVRDEFDGSRAATRAVRERFWGHVTWDQMPPWAMTWRMIVSGWPHFYAGQKVRGHA